MPSRAIIEQIKRENSYYDKGIVPNFLWDMFIKNSEDVFLQGSTRSGKTYGACMFLVNFCAIFRNLGIKFCLYRKGLQVLQTSMMLDLEECIKKARVNPDVIHNRGMQYYTLFGNYIFYDSATSVKGEVADKLTGKKSHIAVIDEANQLVYEEYKQIAMRNERMMIYTYNPTFSKKHWLRKLMERSPSENRLITTYKQNKFLSNKQVKMIESLKQTDPAAWTVYGLGKFGVSIRNVYRVKRLISSHVFNRELKAARDKNVENHTVWGLDFGYQDPMALVKCVLIPETRMLYVILKAYSRKQSETKVSKRVADNYDIGFIYADPSRPEIIHEIEKKEFPIIPARKGPDSINTGIGLVTNWYINVVNNNLADHIMEEFDSYQFEVDDNGDVTDKPTEDNNHAMDAMRYAVMGYYQDYGGHILYA